MALGTKVSDMAAALRDCLATELALRDNPPAETCLIPGEDGRTFLSVGLGQDRCCEGFAWVRVATVTPSIPRDNTQGNCGVSTWQVDYEIGVARCAPFGSAEAGPTYADWTTLFVQVQSDADAMRSAVCCLTPLTETKDTFPTPWLPFGPDGGCTGGIMGVSIQIDDCDCDN